MPPKGSKKNGTGTPMKKPAAAASPGRKAASPKPRKTKADEQEEEEEVVREPEDAGASAAPGAPVGAADPPSVSVEYVGGQRVYTAWVQIQGTVKRVLAPSRPSHDRASADFALIRQLAERPWAGEAIAGKWRRGEIDDKQATQDIKAAPSEAPVAGPAGRSRGKGGGRGRGSRRGAKAQEEGQDEGDAEAGEGAEEDEAEGGEDEEEGAPTLKKPAAAGRGGRGGGRGAGRAKAVARKRPAGNMEETPSRKKRASEEDDEDGA